MEAAYQNSYRPSGFSKLLKMALIITLIVVGGTTISHAVSKHGEDAIAARNCINDKGADLTYFVSWNENRRIQLCLLEDGSGLGVRVLEKIQGKWEELTAFVNHEVVTPEAMISFAETDMGQWGLITFVKEVFRFLIVN